MLYGWAGVVNAIFQYVLLHTSPAGRRFGRAVGSMTETLAASERLIRLPLWVGMPAEDVHYVIDAVATALEHV